MWSFHKDGSKSHPRILDAMKYARNSIVVYYFNPDKMDNCLDYYNVSGQIIKEKNIACEMMCFGNEWSVAAERRQVKSYKKVIGDRRGMHIDYLIGQLRRMNVSIPMFCVWAATELAVRMVDKEEKMPTAWIELNKQFEAGIE